MAKSAAMDSKVNFMMFFKAMGGRLHGLLASTLTPEEKLAQIVRELETKVQEQRVLARQIGAQMRAIADPETKESEPLEALKARRAKLVQLGGRALSEVKAGFAKDESVKVQLGQISQEVKALDAQIKSQEATYDTFKGSYELARDNYRKALAALDIIRSNGPAMLKAIEAHKQALALRDKARDHKSIDTSFLNDLQAELSGVQAEFKSDVDIDADLDATTYPYTVDAALAQMDADSVDSDLMAEFQAAAKK